MVLRFSNLSKVLVVAWNLRIYERSTEEKIAAAERFRQEGNEAYRLLTGYASIAVHSDCVVPPTKEGVISALRPSTTEGLYCTSTTLLRRLRTG